MTEVIIQDHTLEALKEKVVIVTGGSSGIGLGTASLALQHGAKVVMGDLNPPPTSVQSPDMTFVSLDVTSWDGLSNLFQTAFDKHGRIDHVFANAGIVPRTTLFEDKLDANGKLLEPDHRVLDVNLKSIMNTAALALHYMRKQTTPASIVLTASASSFQYFRATDYTVSKHGVLGVMRALIPHLADLPSPRIRLNTISPSWVDTGVAPGAAVRATGATVLEPSDVGRLVLGLMGDQTRSGLLVYSLRTRAGAVVHREIDEGLRQAAKAMCADEGPSLEEVLVRWRGEGVVEGEEKAAL